MDGQLLVVFELRVVDGQICNVPEERQIGAPSAPHVSAVPELPPMNRASDEEVNDRICGVVRGVVRGGVRGVRARNPGRDLVGRRVVVGFRVSRPGRW